MDMLQSLASGSSAGEMVQAAEASFAALLVQAGIPPQEAQAEAHQASGDLANQLAHGASYESALASVHQGLTGYIGLHHLAGSASNPIQELSQALAQGQASALALVHSYLSAGAGEGEVPASVTEELLNSLAHGASVGQALAHAVTLAQTAKLASSHSETPVSRADDAAAALTTGGQHAREAINALGSDLPPEQAGAFADSFVAALTAGKSPAAALQAAQAEAHAFGALSKAGAVPTSASDHLVSALASGQGTAEALAAGGLSHGDAAAAAFAQALSSGASATEALSAADQAATSANQAAAASQGVSADPLIAALASGASAELQAALGASTTGNPLETSAFAAALSQALASGASADAALAQAHDQAQQAISQLAQAQGGASQASQLAVALASGVDARGAIDAAGLGQSNAFFDALQHSLSAGDSIESATAQASNAAQAALAQQDMATQGGVAPDPVLMAMASGGDASAAIAAMTAPTAPMAAQVAEQSGSDSSPSNVATNPSPPSATNPESGHGLELATPASFTFDPSPPIELASLDGTQAMVDGLVAASAKLSLVVSLPLPSPVLPTQALPLNVVANLINQGLPPTLGAPTTITLTDTAGFDHFANQSGTLHGSDHNNAPLSYGISGGSSGGHNVVDGKAYDVSKTSDAGTLYLNSATGQYVFVPNEDYINSLTDNTNLSFTFTLSDGSKVTTQILNIQINATNDAPILAAPAEITLTDTVKNDHFANQAGTLKGSDAEHSTLTYGIAGSGKDQGKTIDGVNYDVHQTCEMGTLYLNSSTGQYVFVPNQDAINALSGDYNQTFTFTLSDGSKVTSQTLNIHFTGTNDAPILATPDPIHLIDTAAKDVFANQTGTLKASDAEHTPLAFGIKDGTSGTHTVVDGIIYDVSKTSAAGTLYLNSATGEYVFVPNADYLNGLDSDLTLTFTFTASDGSLITLKDLLIVINAVHDTQALLSHLHQQPINGQAPANPDPTPPNFHQPPKTASQPEGKEPGAHDGRAPKVEASNSFWEAALADRSNHDVPTSLTNLIRHDGGTSFTGLLGAHFKSLITGQDGASAHGATALPHPAEAAGGHDPGWGIHSHGTLHQAGGYAHAEGGLMIAGHDGGLGSLEASPPHLA